MQGERPAIRQRDDEEPSHRSKGLGAIAALATAIALLWSVHNDWIMTMVMGGFVFYVGWDGAEWLTHRVSLPIRWGLAALAVALIVVMIVFAPRHASESTSTAMYVTSAALGVVIVRSPIRELFSYLRNG
jgi:predicted PurR-regulated permease PerM